MRSAGTLERFGRATVVACLSTLSFVFIVAACSEPPKLVGEGAACAVTTDCALGLVCVPQQDNRRICTGDVTSIATSTPRPTDAARDEGGEGGEAGDASASPETDAPTLPPPDATPTVDSASE